MAQTIGGRMVASYPVQGTGASLPVNQSTWQTIAQNVITEIGGSMPGITFGPGFNCFIDLLCDSGHEPFIRVILDDVRVTDGTTVASATADALLILMGSNFRTILAGFGSDGVGVPTIQFEVWGDGYVPGP